MLGVVPSCAPCWPGQSRSIMNPLKMNRKVEERIHYLLHLVKADQKEERKIILCQEELLTYCHADHYKGSRCFRGAHDSETPRRLITPQERCEFVHALIRLTVEQQQNNFLSVLDLISGHQVLSWELTIKCVCSCMIDWNVIFLKHVQNFLPRFFFFYHFV